MDGDRVHGLGGMWYTVLDRPLVDGDGVVVTGNALGDPLLETRHRADLGFSRF